MRLQRLQSLVRRMGAILVALAALAAGPLRAEAQELTKVTIALPVLASVTMPLHYARDAGIFKKHGLDVDLPVFRGGPPANAALLSGDAQFLAADPYEYLKVADSGREIRVLTLVHSLTFDFVASAAFIQAARHRPQGARQRAPRQAQGNEGRQQRRRRHQRSLCALVHEIRRAGPQSRPGKRHPGWHRAAHRRTEGRPDRWFRPVAARRLHDKTARRRTSAGRLPRGAGTGRERCSPACKRAATTSSRMRRSSPAGQGHDRGGQRTSPIIPRKPRKSSRRAPTPNSNSKTSRTR